MITSKNRFHGRTSLSYVYKRGKTVRGRSLALKYVLNPKRSKFRCAVVVSRRVNKSAVVRNRMRRRIYEQIRELGGKIMRPYDIVFTVFDEQVLKYSVQDLQKEVEVLLQNAGIIARPNGGTSAIIKEQEK